MNLIDIIRRPANPVPYSEGEKIPWNDPAFSARMLREHLDEAACWIREKKIRPSGV